jgi:hypothetical protein
VSELKSRGCAIAETYIAGTKQLRSHTSISKTGEDTWRAEYSYHDDGRIDQATISVEKDPPQKIVVNYDGDGTVKGLVSEDQQLTFSFDKGRNLSKVFASGIGTIEFEYSPYGSVSSIQTLESANRERSPLQVKQLVIARLAGWTDFLRPANLELSTDPSGELDTPWNRRLPEQACGCIEYDN